MKPTRNRPTFSCIIHTVCGSALWIDSAVINTEPNRAAHCESTDMNSSLVLTKPRDPHARAGALSWFLRRDSGAVPLTSEGSGSTAGGVNLSKHGSSASCVPGSALSKAALVLQLPPAKKKKKKYRSLDSEQTNSVGLRADQLSGDVCSGPGVWVFSCFWGIALTGHTHWVNGKEQDKARISKTP